MDSSPYGDPLSVAKVVPMAAPSYGTITGIRAPVTADDSDSDFEYSVSSMSRINSPASSYHSVTEVESEGFVSGEDDESETESERPYVTHQDGEVVEETHFVKEYSSSAPSMLRPKGEIVQEKSNSFGYGFYRPSVKSPHVGFAQESSFLGGNPFFRPFVRSPDEISYRGAGNINNDSDDSRPVMSESGDELIEHGDYVQSRGRSRPIVVAMDDNVLESEPILDGNLKILPVMRRLDIPIAQISGDTDDDSQGSEVFEDVGISGIGRVSSLEVLHRINSAPRVSMSDVDEGEGMVVNNGDFGEKVVVDDSVHFVISSDMIQNEGLDADKGARTNSLVVHEKNISETERNGSLKHLHEEIQEKFDEIADHRTCIDLVDQREPTSIVFNQDIGSAKQECGQEFESEVETSTLSYEAMGAELERDHEIDGHRTHVEFDHGEPSNIIFNQYIGIGNQESEQEIVTEVENLTFQTEAMVVEMERDQAFTSFSGGGFLLDHSQENDGRVAMGTDEPADADAGISDDHRQRIDYAAFLEAVGGAASDDGTENLSREGNRTDFFMLPSTNGPRKAAMELTPPAKGDPDFSLCIMVIGKTGVGKSATINSIFGGKRTEINAFEPSTGHVNEIVGHLEGIKVKIFDTPGLRTSPMDRSINRKMLSSVKKVIKKSPPDVILYVDRLDMQTSNLHDLPLLKYITSSLGSSIWRKSLIVLTHAASNPPDGPDGHPLSHEVFVAERSRVVHQLISRSSGEPMMMNHPGSLILVENRCQENECPETVVHNGESWRSQLLFLCCSMMTLSDSKSSLKIQNFLNRKKNFGLQTSSSNFLSSLLQSSDHGKVSNFHSGDIFDPELDNGVIVEYNVLNGENKMKRLKQPFLGENVVCGIKIEDSIAVGEPFTFVGNAGFILSLGDTAYGVNVDLRKGGDDYTYGQDRLSVGLSVTRCGGNFFYGWNAQSHFSVCGNSEVNVVAGLNGKLNGQICVKTRCSDHLQIAGVALIPIARVMLKKIFQQCN